MKAVCYQKFQSKPGIVGVMYIFIFIVVTFKPPQVWLPNSTQVESHSGNR